MLANFGQEEEDVFGNVQVLSCSSSSTTLLIISPPYEIDSSLQSINVPVVISGSGRPEQKVSFSYRYYPAQPVITSVEPASAPSEGGARVFLRLKEFPLSSSFSIVFAGSSVADSDITVWEASGLITLISFITPRTAPGASVPVQVSTKGCAIPCRFSAAFDFQQLDMSLPILLEPIPISGPYQEALLTVRLVQFPANGHVEVLFGNMSGSAFRVQEASTTDVVVLSISPQPFSQEAGVCKVTVSCNGKAASFEYRFYDGSSLRIVGLVPLIPTSPVVWGRQVELRKEITVLLANSPQGLQPSEYAVQVRASINAPSLMAEVLSVREVATCNSNRLDCNRTMLVVLMPFLTSPGLKPASISAVRGFTSTIQWMVEYASSCTGGYDSYCQLRGSSFVVDVKRLMDQPSAGCKPDMCVDSNLMRMPVVLSASPSYGPASGGTLVTLEVLDFPCFSAQELVVSVGQGAFATAFATVISLTPAPGSSLLAPGSSLLTIRTPPATPAAGEVVTFSLQSLLGGPASTKTANFAFEFMPVIVGPPIVRSFVPSSVLDSAPLSLAVALANVPRFSIPFNSSACRFTINGVPVTKTPEILESSLSETTLSLVLPGPWVGVPMLNITVCVMPNCDLVAELRVTVLQAPDASVTAVFPDTFCSWGQHAFAVTFSYVPPNISISQLSAVMYTQGRNTANLNFTNLRRLSPASCMIRDCTVFSITLSSPPVNPDGMDAEGLASVTISGGTFSVTTSIMYTSSSAASLEMVAPSMQFLRQLNVEPIEIIVNNFPSRSCTKSSSCAEEALAQGLQVM